MYIAYLHYTDRQPQDFSVNLNNEVLKKTYFKTNSTNKDTSNIILPSTIKQGYLFRSVLLDYNDLQY